MYYWSNVLNLHQIKYTSENIKHLINIKFPDSNYKSIILKSNYQSGGAKFKFNNYDITLIGTCAQAMIACTMQGTEDNNSIIYSLKNNNNCLLISIDKNILGLAEIIGISADYGCYDDNKKKMNGSELLDLAIYFITKRKKFETKEKNIITINRIELTDNSHISCNGEKTMLSNMYTLLNGETWYMSRGFTPIKRELNQINENKTNKLINLMFNNKNIINSLTVEKSKIYELIISIQNNNNKYVINELLEFIKQNKNKPLSYLFKKIKNNFNKYCSIIVSLNTKFYDSINLYSFYGVRFVLKI
jgi:hypothetical protein